MSGLIAVISVCFFSIREREPSYNGRTLSEWLEIYRTNRNVIPTPVVNQNREQAIHAVAAIGSNAIPFLLRWNAQQSPSWYETAEKVNRRLKSKQVTQLLDRRRPQIYRDWAGLGFWMLGTNARPAYATLVTQFANSKGEAMSLAIYEIGQLGVDGLLFCVDQAQHGDNEHSVAAARQIPEFANLRSNALPAIPILLDIIQTNIDSRLTDNIITLLGELAIDPDHVVPAITNAAYKGDFRSRENAIEALVHFQNQAAMMLPLLRDATHDDEPRVRSAATNALAKIASEALANSTKGDNRQ